MECSKMAVSSMFLRNVTCIDHALIDTNGKIIGGSFHQEISVTGEVDEHEQVVVDFSAVKKQIKAIIDDKENGFDHKLIIVEGLSNCHVSNIDEVTLKIDTPYFNLEVPKNAVKIIKRQFRFASFKDEIESKMEIELAEGLNKLNNTDKITVQFKLTEDVFGSDPKKFTYFHGLKHSTSWGCNNIAHGHLSFVEVYDDLDNRNHILEDMIAKYLDGAMLVYKENLIDENKLQYTTSRGTFKLEFSPKDVKVIYMDSETTIENIVEHVWDMFYMVIKYYGIKKIFLSEGLQKGAFKQNFS